MENTKPKNPNAFPCVEIANAYDNFHSGMTLRDYFANSAMQAMITGNFTRNDAHSPDKQFEIMELVSVNAYWYADQMLKQREL